MNSAGTTHVAITQRSSSRTATGGLLALTFLLALCGSAAAQGQAGAAGESQLEEAGPPPLKYIPEEMRRRLATAKDMKDRTKLSLLLCEERLTAAATHVEADRYEAATAELGVYEALVKDAIRFVQSSGRTSNKQRDLFKRIDLALRSHTTRLETVRRGLPAHSGIYVQAALEFVRDARTEALNAFFDDTVLRSEPPTARAAEGERARGNALAAPSQVAKPNQR